MGGPGSGSPTTPEAHGAKIIAAVTNGRHAVRTRLGAELNGDDDSADAFSLWEKERKANIDYKRLKARKEKLVTMELAKELIRTEVAHEWSTQLMATILNTLAATDAHIDMLGLEPAQREIIKQLWLKVDRDLRQRLANMPALVNPPDAAVSM